jgi:hypothetical protein
MSLTEALRCLAVTVIALGGSLAPPPARADSQSFLTVKIELRVLDCLAAPSGRSAVAVLYDPANSESQKDATGVLQTLEQSAGLAQNDFAPRLVEAGNLAAQGALKAIILTAGLGNRYDEVMRYAVANQILVLASGPDCVRDRRCMVGIKASPDVEIAVNQQALRQSGIRFNDGFQWMVHDY